MLLIKLCVVYFEGFEATARLTCGPYTTKALTKSDLHTARCQQGPQGCVSITEYHKTVTSYRCSVLQHRITMSKGQNDVQTVHHEAQLSYILLAFLTIISSLRATHPQGTYSVRMLCMPLQNAKMLCILRALWLLGILA